MTHPATARERDLIEQALLSYSRGLDRFDRDLALTAFAPGAVLSYSGIYTGDAAGFMDWAWSLHRTLETNIHRIANVFIVRSPSGDLVSESYVATTLRRRDSDEYIDRVGYGRYIDRWISVGDRLAIAERDYLTDLVSETQIPAEARLVVTSDPGVPTRKAARDRSDASYRLLGRADD